MLLDAASSIFRIDVIPCSGQLIAARIARRWLAHIVAAIMIALFGTGKIDRPCININRRFIVVHSETHYLVKSRPAARSEKTLPASIANFHSPHALPAVGSFLRLRRPLFAVALLAWIAGCASAPPPAPPAVRPDQARALIGAALPGSVHDRAGWTDDLYAALTLQSIEPTRENICAAVAVIEQESNFQVDPVIPGLPAIAWREIDSRAEHAGVPRVLLHGALQLRSPTGTTYSERIDAAKTEKDLSDIFEDFIGTVPMGRTLFAERDPVRTRGPMQVNVAFAEQYAAARPYPYPVKVSIADEVFSRRGGLYFGVGHLLAYEPHYDQYLYRFADFNAGQFASRNAAFQRALSRVSGLRVVADGALLPHGEEKTPGETELAARAMKLRLNLDDAAIHDALARSKKSSFEHTILYRGVFALADKLQASPAPRAAVPRIVLRGPKLSRNLSTDWYARRVNERFGRCLQKRR
jgi:hypothetical protein